MIRPELAALGFEGAIHDGDIQDATVAQLFERFIAGGSADPTADILDGLADDLSLFIEVEQDVAEWRTRTFDRMRQRVLVAAEFHRREAKALRSRVTEAAIAKRVTETIHAIVRKNWRGPAPEYTIDHYWEDSKALPTVEGDELRRCVDAVYAELFGTTFFKAKERTAEIIELRREAVST